MRRNKEHVARTVVTIQQPKRHPGRPPMTWTGTTSKDMKTLDLNPEMTQNLRNRIKRTLKDLGNRLGIPFENCL